jgi:SAM-dependent methyltransferase
LAGRTVIDVGCGDGTYTLELLQGGPRDVLGIDPAAEAIARARERSAGRDNVRFAVTSVYDLAELGETFDVAVVRGVLHHLDRASDAASAIARVARVIVVVEPNGCNPVLKIIEKVSRYHREHGEKSYWPGRLDHWFESAGGRVTGRWFIGQVPMFCPDRMAGMLKMVEPVVERVPLVRRIMCAQYVQRVEMGGKR